MCTGDALNTLDPNLFGKWTHYLTLKAAFYEAYVSASVRVGTSRLLQSVGQSLVSVLVLFSVNIKGFCHSPSFTSSW